MSERLLKIGDIARQYNVTLRTLRFYEDRGLVNPQRSGTTRLYSKKEQRRLEIALFCKKIGLSLGEIHEVLELHEDDAGTPAKLRMRDIYQTQLEYLERHQRETSAAISDLQDKLDAMNSAIPH